MVERALALTSYLVREYDEALAFFVGALGFELVEDTPLGDGKRWVVVRPGRGGGALLLARAADAEQRAAVGRQAGGRVFLFLHTDNLDRDRMAMVAAGVGFLEATRHELYGKVAVFADLYGQRWDLIEPATGVEASSRTADISGTKGAEDRISHD